jgi:hypothetical protein
VTHAVGEGVALHPSDMSNKAHCPSRLLQEITHLGMYAIFYSLKTVLLPVFQCTVELGLKAVLFMNMI